MHSYHLGNASAGEFSVIFSKNSRKYTRYSLRFLICLMKNSLTHLRYQNDAVLP